MDGRRVLVVGASSGIGAAVVRAVAARGAAVTVSARRRERLEALVDEMGTGHAAQGDATVPAAGRAPDRRFMRVVMGNTAPTEFSNHMNVDLLGEALEAWE
ncbi:MAG: SDR family NAD(P)-dependent oxidoreductase, partial [Acidimicrobiia bacterium]|nr:SDR family NAD(P)-dependent oxidoreductase [Acidimicrobiia bacterium]